MFKVFVSIIRNLYFLYHGNISMSFEDQEIEPKKHQKQIKSSSKIITIIYEVTIRN